MYLKTNKQTKKASDPIPQKHSTRKEYFPANYIKPALLWYQNQAKTFQNSKIQTGVTQEHRCKNSKQDSSKSNPIYIKW